MDEGAVRHLRYRVSSLEASQRRLAAIALLCCLAALVAWTGSTREASEVVKAKSFQLVDDDGKLWGELKVASGRPSLLLYDNDGVERVSLAHTDEETALFLRDGAGDTRVGVAQFSHGGGGVALHGPRAKGAAVLYFKESGSLTFYDSAGAVVMRMPN